MRWMPAPTLVALSASLGAGVFAPSEAAACSCLAGLAWSLPVADSRDVPINPQIQLAFAFDAPEDLLLIGPGGTGMTTLATRQFFGSYVLVTLSLEPGTLLSPKTSYEVRSNGESLLSFSTGSAQDLEDPTLGAVASVSGGYNDGCSEGVCSSCGDSVAMYARYEGVSDDTSPHDQMFYLVYLSTAGVPDTSSPYAILPEWHSLGYSACAVTFPDLKAGDTVTIRAQAIDVAGNRSALSAPVSGVVAEDPDEQSPGCGGGAGQARGAWVAAILGLFPFLRRRCG